MKDSVMTDKVVRGIFGGLLLAAVFTLGIEKVADFDAWTHLALGRQIVQHRGFPASEQFNFPSLDTPYYNSEWLFGLVFYLAYLAAGLAGVILLKASIVTVAFFFLFKDSLLPQDEPSRRPLGVVAATVVLTLILLMVRHRIVERPDIALMVFLAFTIYALNAYVYEERRYLYLLPALQLLWVNMHPSIVVGAVPLVAFLFGGQLQRLLHERFGMELPGTPSKSQLRTIAVVFAAVLAASLLNPYGIGAFLAPFKLAASTWLRDEIAELQAPKFSDLYGAPFIVTALLVLIFILSIRRLSLTSVLLVVPFVYLGLSAKRFIFLLAIVSAPVVARHLRLLAGRLSPDWAHRLSLPAGLFALSLMVAVTGLSLARAGPFFDPIAIPGFGINYEPFPEGALRYLDRIGMTGKLFNEFSWGGYIVWRDYPKRIPIIDGRGHVPPGLLDEVHVAQTAPASLNRLQKKFGFDVAVVKYPPRETEVLSDALPDIDLALTSPNWALVYWDDLSLLYLRRTEALAKIIQRDEYLHVKPANGIPNIIRRAFGKNLFAPIEAELRRNIAESQSSTAYVLLGAIYNDFGLYEKAIETLSHVRDFPLRSNIEDAYLGLAIAYERMGKAETAIAYYKKAARLSSNPATLYSLGAVLERIGNDREAIRYLELALQRDRHLVWAYPPLLRAYGRAGRTDRVKMHEAAYRDALAHGQGALHFKKGLKLYLDKKLDEAMVEFRESLRLHPRNPSALSNLGYVYYDLGLLDQAFSAQRRALEVDPTFANAHYGLALIHFARGAHAMARVHFENYLRLEPSGYWSRKAQDQLSRITER